MGISDLYSVIEENCEDVIVTVKMSQLCGQKLAVDISIFLNKYIKTAGAERWVDNFIILMCCLKKNGIKPVCIFDGPNPPEEKKREQQRRRAEGAKRQQRINHGKRLVKQIYDEYIQKEKDLQPSIISEISTLMGKKRVNFEDTVEVYNALKDVIEKQERQNLPILPIYGEKAKEIIECMGFPYFQASGEAEALCAGMCCLGLVDGVLSEDTDVLAYGAPFLVSRINLSDETVAIVSHQDVLSGIGLNHEEFLDLCILLSCDYNSRVKGYPPDGKKRRKPACIGAKSAVIMIKEYRRLEEIECHLEDPDPLIYKRCRQLFTPPKRLPEISIPYSKPIDKTRFIEFLKRERARVSIKYILDTCAPPPINYVVDKEEVVEDWAI